MLKQPKNLRGIKICFLLNTYCNTYCFLLFLARHPKVINLSSTCLTDTQVRLTEYFANKNDIIFDEQTQLLVKNKGSFQPPEKSKQNA